MLSNIRRLDNHGFTLMEILIAIAILGILAVVGMGNFYTSLKKGRDARRKSDLEQVQKALEMYYNDHGQYPIDSEFDVNSPWGEEFTDGATIYMTKLPVDPKTRSDYQYDYETDDEGTFFQLYTCLENTQDQGPGVNQDGYAGTDCGCPTVSDPICNYGISSPNTEP